MPEKKCGAKHLWGMYWIHDSSANFKASCTILSYAINER